MPKKYRPSKDDYDFVCHELSLHKQTLGELKAKVKKYESALTQISTSDTEPYLYKLWSKQALND